MESKVLAISLSNNADHQDTLHSISPYMEKYIYYKIGSKDLFYNMTGLEKSKTYLFKVPKTAGISFQTFNINSLRQIWHKVREIEPDLIYFESAHTWNLPLILLSRVFFGEIKVVHSIHDFVPHMGDRNAHFVNVYNRLILTLSDYILLRSKVGLKHMKQEHPNYAHKFQYLPLWRRWNKRSTNSHRDYVLFFGRLNKYKGLDNLIEIARENQNYQFKVVGKPAKNVKAELQVLSKLHNVDLMTGYVSNEKLTELVSKSAVVILPYESATQSGVIVDTYMESKPVIAFNQGGISEQILNGETGYLVETGDISNFSKSIKKIYDMSNDQYLCLCNRAYDYGMEQYSPSMVANYFSQLIEKWLE